MMSSNRKRSFSSITNPEDSRTDVTTKRQKIDNDQTYKTKYPHHKSRNCNDKKRRKHSKRKRSCSFESKPQTECNIKTVESVLEECELIINLKVPNVILPMIQSFDGGEFKQCILCDQEYHFDCDTLFPPCCFPPI